MSLQLYIIFMCAGGVFLLFSLLASGEADHAADHSGELHEADLDGEFHGEAGDHNLGPMSGKELHSGFGGLLATAIPILSFRFWVFASTFFGLSGLILESQRMLAPNAVFVTALGFGYLMGALATNALRMMRRTEVSTSVSLADLVGRAATVVLPVEPGATGKVRIATATGMMEMSAIADRPDSSMALQDKVRIKGFDGMRVVVENHDGA